MSAELQPTATTRIRRLPERGSHDVATLHAILDATPACQVAFVDGGRPHTIPMLHWREDDHLYLHASRGSRLAWVLAEGVDACVAVTLLDGLVLARSAYSHSMNYRSAMVYGRFTEVAEADAKLRHLEAMFDRVLPGRWAQCRPPSEAELAATAVLELPLAEAVAKVRRGPPADAPEDLGYPAWAGVLPCAVQWGAPVPAEGLAEGLALPPTLLDRLRG